MLKCCHIKFSDLRNKQVVDDTGREIGQVNDFVVSLSDNRIQLKSVVLGGRKRSELLQSIGLKSNESPVFDVRCIDRVEDRVYLSSKCELLRTMLNSGPTKNEEFRLSELTKLKVVDADGLKIGNVNDVWFDDADKIWLVLGGGFIEETLEKIGVQPDIDLLVPAESIERVGRGEMRLRWTKFQLSANCENEYERYKREVSSRFQPGDPRYTQMRLTGAQNRGLV